MTAAQTRSVPNLQFDIADVVLSGGTLDVLSGGTVTSATVSSGGIERVFAAGTTVNTRISGGGTLDLVSGASATGSITSGTGGVLEIEGTMPAATISGFVSGDEFCCRISPTMRPEPPSCRAATRC